MNLTVFTWTILAQVSRWERLGDGLHRSRSKANLIDLLPVVIILALVGVGIAVYLKLKQRNDFKQPCNDPQKLFRELSIAHALDRSSQKLLLNLATEAGLEQPAEVFLRPALFDLEGLPQQLHAQQSHFQTLKEKLF